MKVRQEEVDRVLARCRKDLVFHGENLLKVLDEEGSLVPLRWKGVQASLHKSIEQQKAETGTVRHLILKSRRARASTYIAGRFYNHSSLNSGVNVMVLGHDDTAQSALYGITKRFQENNPLAPALSMQNESEMRFAGLDSGYRVGIMGQKTGKGRSMTLHRVHLCLDENSWVETPRGYVRMKECSVGDLVKTHTGKTAQISYISSRKKNCLSITVIGRNEPLVCSPEHKIYTRDGFKEAGSLSEGDYIGTPVQKISGDAIWVYGALPSSPHHGGRPMTEPALIKPDYALGRVFGLYLAEGHIPKRNGGKWGTRPANVVFGVHRREVDRTVRWIRECGLNVGEPRVRHSKNSLTSTVTVYSLPLAELLLSKCGRTTTKRVPGDWNKCGPEFCRGLLHGYLAGDGYCNPKQNNRSIVAPSICSGITVGVSNIVMSLGYGVPSIRRRGGAVRHGRNEKEQWSLHIFGDAVDRLQKEMEAFTGWRMPDRKVSGRNHYILDGGFAWLKIRKIEDSSEKRVMDFEVDHEDHSYCVFQGSVSNSEFAFADNAAEHIAAIHGVVRPQIPGTEIIIETTANGPTGEFYRRWNRAMAGKSRYKAFFFPWFMDTSNRLPPPKDFAIEPDEREYVRDFGLDPAQVCFMRAQIDELGSETIWHAEYPATPELAFSKVDGERFINPTHVIRARKSSIDPHPGAPVILGVDPASMGGDKFAIAARKGNKILWIRWRKKVTRDEALAWIKDCAREVNAQRINIDNGNIGVYLTQDLMQSGPEMARIVNPINFGSPSMSKKANPQKPGPVNRRAEMWARMKEAIESEIGLDIPDLDELHADLVAPQKKHRGNDFLLEAKTDMRKRGVESPDMADAVALTFAFDEYIPPSDGPKDSAGRELPVWRETAESRENIGWMAF